MKNQIRVRFAPSPTGRMHVGHMRAALPNALFAKKEGGSFIVRFEDTDIERQVENAEKLILEDLSWLGLTADEDMFQGGPTAPYNTLARHERGDYQEAVKTLMEQGRAYECYASVEELDVMRKLQRARNEPPRYDNRHRTLSESDKQKFQAEGRKPVVRFKLNDGEIVFTDLVRGEQKFLAENLGGDPVIVRSTGVPLFTLGGVVDDIAMGITHVIRGEDHVVNTAQQVQIFEALGAELPVFAHLPLMLDKDGHKMSKRLGALRIQDLKEKGYMPNAILAYMAGLGFSTPAPLTGLADLANWYNINTNGRAPVRFDEEQLIRANAHVLHSLSFEEIQPYLANFLPTEALERQRLEAFWYAARENIETLSDLKAWYELAFEKPAAAEFEAEDKAYLATAKGSVTAETFTPETWSVWTSALKEQTGRKGKALFMPLRLALTGQAHGPDMASLLPVIGRKATLERLNKYL